MHIIYIHVSHSSLKQLSAHWILYGIRVMNGDKRGPLEIPQHIENDFRNASSAAVDSQRGDVFTVVCYVRRVTW